MTIDQLYDRAFAYLELNPERFTDQEKMKFMQSLQEWILGKSDTIDDEVYDFLIQTKLFDEKSREETFASYLNGQKRRIKALIKMRSIMPHLRCWRNTSARA